MATIFSYGEILVENITPLMADIGSVMANIESPMATIKRPMANIRSLMANITSRYGEKYSGMAKILWGRSRMAEITLRGTLGCLAYHGNGCFFGCFFCCGFCFLTPLVKRKASQPRSREWYFTMQLGCQILVQRLD
jgi:hypothetical protein